MQEPPLKPAQITAEKFDEFEYITQGNINDILEKINKGEREELNGYYLPINYYLNLAKWMERIEAYIEQSEAYFAEIDNRYDSFLTKEKPDDGER